MSRRRLGAVGAFAAAAAVWPAAASQLWPTRVPDELRTPNVQARTLFDARALERAEDFEQFIRWDFLLAEVVTVLVLALYAWRGERLTRESAAGRIGTGMLLGMLGLGILWLTQIPFELAALWWFRRYDVLREGYAEWAVEYSATLAGEFLFICLALLIVMVFAGALRETWWIAGAPTFVALAALFAFIYPHMAPDLQRLDNAALERAAREYARAQGTEPVPVRVEEVSSYTTAPNAEAAGMESSRRIILWDTLLDGRFADDEILFVLAHELAHHSRDHIWKSIGWYALFAVPGTLLIALVTRRRGGMGEPRAVPLGLFVFVVLSFAAQPVFGVIVRRMEAEADWVALETTENPDAARSLFVHFTTVALADPDPPAWARLLLDTHPTVLERIEMAETWRARSGR